MKKKCMYVGFAAFSAQMENHYSHRCEEMARKGMGEQKAQG